MEDMNNAFVEETFEMLESIEGLLLDLEKDPDNKELLNSLFRVMHTIKGSAGMFGYDDIASFTHIIENVMDQLREQTLSLSKDIVDLTLQARDLIQDMINGKADKKVLKKIHAAFQKLADSSGRIVKSESPKKANNEDALSEKRTYRIAVKPMQDIFHSGTRPLLVLRELYEIGEVTCIPSYRELPDIDGFDPEKLYIQWEILLSTTQSMNAVRDIFIFMENDADVTIEEVKNFKEYIHHLSERRIGEILVDRGVVDEDILIQALGSQRKIGEVLLEEKIVSESDLKDALREQAQMRKLKEKADQLKTVSSVRVNSQKLDSLVDLVGELVTLQARMTQNALKFDSDNELVLISEQFERLSGELRETAMAMRMLPIETTFSKFRRLVRDLSDDLDKQIDLETIGGETELDKTVIESLNDPLVHIIRNSIDHGIENPSKRIEAGKAERGKIQLIAEHSGANVLIKIRDDGKGIDRDAIISKALGIGILSDGVGLSDREVFDLVFAPGFSTATTVTNISGRGVGMDVVKRQIESLRGSVHIDSKLGEYTEVKLTIPLTLAIIEGLLIRVGTEYYVIPLGSVFECIEHKKESTQPNKRIASVRGEMLPFIRLDTVFGLEQKEQEIEQMIVVQSNGYHYGIIVDEVIGDYQTVIKKLGNYYRDVEVISGATILGDGNVALILDINKLMDTLDKEIINGIQETAVNR